MKLNLDKGNEYFFITFWVRGQRSRSNIKVKGQGHLDFKLKSTISLVFQWPWPTLQGHRSKHLMQLWVMDIFSTPRRSKRGNSNLSKLSKLRRNWFGREKSLFPRFIQLIFNVNKIEINSTYKGDQEYLVLKFRIWAGESNVIDKKWRNTQYKL